MKIYVNLSRVLFSALLIGVSSLGLAESKTDPHQGMPQLPPTQGKIYGKVIETLDVENYTYVHVDSGKETYWAATSPVQFQEGSMVSFVPNMPMRDFTSKSLDRKFDLIYFVGQIYTDKVGDHPVKANSSGTAAGVVTEQSLANIQKAANGVTINEALTQKQELAGKTLVIRGMVDKYTAQVMGKNWIHIRDSSSPKDLTVTTNDEAAIGEVVVVSGKLQLDKDFGFGYSYEVLLEDSTVTVE